jgi:hypothetical protein
MENQIREPITAWEKRRFGQRCAECNCKIWEDTGTCNNCPRFPTRAEKDRLYQQGWIARLTHSGSDLMYQHPVTKRNYNVTQVKAMLAKGEI